MKVLVIGASGFVGRHLLAAARAQGHEALGTQARDRDPSLLRFDLATDRISERVPAAWFSGEPVTAVLCAAFSQIDACAREPERSFAINVSGTTQALGDLAERGARVVFISTGSVYDGAQGYYHESMPRGPLNTYGRHKAAVEEWLEANLPDTFIPRLDKVVGDDPAEPHLFSEWYRAVSEGRPVRCIAGQLFCPTLVDDVAAAVLLGAQQGLRGAYHVVNSEFFYRDELARQFLAAWGRPVPVETIDQASLGFAEPRGLKSYLDGTRFAAATGMRFTSMREAFMTFLERAGERASADPEPTERQPTHVRV